MSCQTGAGDYHYRYNGKEFEESVELYAYGARYYDPSIGRFTGVDPIADQFAWVSPYNYAENRPVDGIDLWGLQYVNSNSALFKISYLQTWKSTGLFQSGTDLLGRQYIGTSIPINSVGFSLPQSGNYKGALGAVNNMVKQIKLRRGRLPIAKSTGMPDRRFNSSKNFNQNVRGAGRVGLILEAINLANDINNAYTSWNAYWGNDEGTKQSRFIKQSWQGVVDGINAGFFTPEQITIENLSSVADYLYRGTPIDDAALQGVATKISEEILDNAKIEVVQPESGLDNFKRDLVIKN